MKIPTNEFLEKYTELFIARKPYIATLAYWKMRHLIEEGDAFYLPEYDSYYMIRDRHLLVYYSPDNKMHIDTDILNGLDCISLPADMYDAIKDKLSGFTDSRNWNLRYDFSYEPPQTDVGIYQAVDFDFDNLSHYDKAAKIINDCDSGFRLSAKNIKRMTNYSAFEPVLWFFVKDKASQELIAISISEHDKTVRQTDLDWIFVSPGFQGKGAGRYLIEKTIERCKDKSDDICVSGEASFYRKCGFYDYELWVWAHKDGYQFSAPGIQP